MLATIIDQPLQNVNIIRSGFIPQGNIEQDRYSIATLINNPVKGRYAIEIHDTCQFFLIEITGTIYETIRQTAVNLALISERQLGDDNVTFNDFLDENSLAAEFVGEEALLDINKTAVGNWFNRQGYAHMRRN